MSKLEGMPITAVSNTGDRFLGADSRPELLTNLIVDEQYAKAMSAALTGLPTGSVVSVPIKAEDLQDSVIGINTRQVAPMGFAESRAPYTAPDVAQAAIDHRVFGMGYLETFKSDKPQQGINYLREQVQVPIDTSVPFNTPAVGPWNPVNMNMGILGEDPRYQAPKFAPPM